MDNGASFESVPVASAVAWSEARSECYGAGSGYGWTILEFAGTGGADAERRAESVAGFGNAFDLPRDVYRHREAQPQRLSQRSWDTSELQMRMGMMT